MRITQIAWSKKRKNHLVNFYALEPDAKGHIEILNPQFSWHSNNDALAQINTGRSRTGATPYHGKLLHVVLDMSSGRLYLPNNEGKEGINSDPMLLAMYDSIRIKIEKLVDFLPLAAPINGDPFDTIRLRKVKDFHSVADFIKRQSKSVKQFEKDVSLTVVEANLQQMPATFKALFSGRAGAESKQWLYIHDGKVIDFIVREQTPTGPKDVVIHQQKPPFILINTSPELNVSDANKERIVVTAYREYAAAGLTDDPRSRESPQIQSYKYLMYIGWSLKELSLFALRNQEVPNFAALMHRSAYLYNAAKSLKADGYPDPAANPYYYSFEIGSDFPVAFKPEIGVDVFNYSRQPEIFRIVFYDARTSYITIKTPMYIPDDVVKKVFLPKSPVFVAQYDPTEKAIKTNSSSANLAGKSKGTLNAITTDVSNVTGKPSVDIPIKERFLTEVQFERKHISDYPQAAEIIKDLCAKLGQKPDKESRSFPRNIQFDDLEVIVGPWKEVAGFLGGYCNAKRMADKPAIEPIPGFKIYPPSILIDNRECPSVGDRTHVIIHEYRHHINAQLWIDSPIYDMSSNPNDTQGQQDEKRIKYLQSTDERLAHKTQFKYMLAIGMSREQILRKMVGRKPKIQDIPVTKEYLGIINEAAFELNSEKYEIELEDRMKSEIQKRQDELSYNIDDADFFDPDDPLDL